MALYVTNSVLIKRYIARRAPAFASHEQIAGGAEKWEYTAGLGIVPRWVSLIGLLAFGCLLAIPLLVVVHLFR